MVSSYVLGTTDIADVHDIWGTTHIQASYLSVCLGLSLILWLLPYVYLGVPFGLALLYPVTILAIELVAFTSLRKSLIGNLSWKGRNIPKTHWKWI